MALLRHFPVGQSASGEVVTFTLSSFLLLLLLFIQGSEGNSAAQCAQFGLNAFRPWERQQFVGDKSTRGYWTIGTEKFDSRWIFSIGTVYMFWPPNDLIFDTATYNDKPCPWPYRYCSTWGCINKDATHTLPCVEDSIAEIRTYLVKQDGRVLQGWLHVEVELMDESDEIELIYIQMRDESFNAIGQFVPLDHHPKAKCTPSKSYLSTPTQYQFYPCSATGLRESKTSAGIMMAKREDYAYLNDVEKMIHTSPISKGVHFLWKMDEYWCSRHLRFQPFAYLLTKKNRINYQKSMNFLYAPGTTMLRKIPNYWIYPKWFGASDILFKDGDLDCSELVLDDHVSAGGAFTPAALESWFRDIHHQVVLKDDSWHPDHQYSYLHTDQFGSVIEYRSAKLCQADPHGPNSTVAAIPSFSGRCEYLYGKEVGRGNFQGCNTNTSSQEFDGLDLSKFTNYHDELEEYHRKRWVMCDPAYTCRAPIAADIPDILRYPRGNLSTAGGIKKYVIGVDDIRTKKRIFKVWRGRKYHGMLSVIAAFFLTPLYIFMARYYKETFMARRFLGTPCWYWIHLGGVIGALTLFASGRQALKTNTAVWGWSETPAAKFHYYVGYLSFVIFGVMVVCGGQRMGINYEERGHRPARLCSLAIHSILGFTHHILNLIVVMSATFIPLSPSLLECGTNGLPFGVGLVSFQAFILCCADVLFHLVLTILQCLVDRNEKIERGCSCPCPIVPFMPFWSTTDLQGAGVRKLMLILYLFMTISFGVVATLLIGLKELPLHCRIGPMTCKHLFGCSPTAIKYEEWFLAQPGAAELKIVRN